MYKHISFCAIFFSSFTFCSDLVRIPQLLLYDLRHNPREVLFDCAGYFTPPIKAHGDAVGALPRHAFQKAYSVLDQGMMPCKVAYERMRQLKDHADRYDATWDRCRGNILLPHSYHSLFKNIMGRGDFDEFRKEIAREVIRLSKYTNSKL